MKLSGNNTNSSRRSAAMLIECLVYMAVFTILLGLGTAAFYVCWDHSRAVISATTDIESALRAGECWRADVRNATGEISTETTATGETVQIPAHGKQIIYQYEAGELRREIPSQKQSRLLLKKVKASEMKMDDRGKISAWRWELQLAASRPEDEAHLPLLFTFEAAQIKP